MSRRGSGVASPNPCCWQILSQEEANIWLVLACQIQEGFDWLGQGLVKGRSDSVPYAEQDLLTHSE